MNEQLTFFDNEKLFNSVKEIIELLHNSKAHGFIVMENVYKAIRKAEKIKL